MFYYLVFVDLGDDSYSFPIMSEVESSEQQVIRLAEWENKFEEEWDSYEATVEEITEEEFYNWFE